MPKKDGASWTCLLQAHCHAGTTHDSEEILQKMPFAKTIVHWTMLLDAHAKAGNLDRAREVYDQMPDPDAIAANAMLAAYAHRGYMHEANALFEQVGDKVDAATKNIMILAHGSAGNLEASKRLFDEIIERDLYSWSSLMRAFSLSSMNEDAIHLFRCMLVEGFAPNEVVLLVYATAACGRASSLDDSRSFFANMLPDYGVSPGLDHYDCMVGAFGAAKKMEEARELIDSMPFEADARVWMTLLACCRRHLDAENGKLCAERLFVLDPENVSPYKILAEIYSQTGREKDIPGLKKMVRDKGLHKLEAESLIQIDGITHKFRVGDTAHPSIKKVRKEVARLAKLMEKDHGYKHENLGWSECGGGVHSEKLAIAYALCEKSREISLVNNLRMCGDCHTSAKMISSVVKRKITVRDTQRLHGFENGVCSCADTW
ncbi:pentatricopeptide repeat-containing protein At4g02750 [Selaginella moellendorffii]|nr:pentatricopeptide repeat-containing protein At4g02750 [Selaginella moellendorffii]|eukprot:XP_002988896.2 pentatricopeptide repeat-containing protein At4g02750 [Selaginella moellendorffii]